MQRKRQAGAVTAKKILGQQKEETEATKDENHNSRNLSHLDAATVEIDHW